jgi:hypothetical protein
LISNAGFEGALIAEFLEALCAVVGGDEGRNGGGEFGAVTVGASVDDLLFERAVEALDDAVGFRFADEGEAGREAVETALTLEPIGDVLAAVIVA